MCLRNSGMNYLWDEQNGSIVWAFPTTDGVALFPKEDWLYPEGQQGPWNKAPDNRKHDLSFDVKIKCHQIYAELRFESKQYLKPISMESYTMPFALVRNAVFTSA